MSNLQRFEPAPKNRCATPLWMQICICTKGCKLRYEASAIVTALARRPPHRTNRQRLHAFTEHRGARRRFSCAVAAHCRCVLCSSRLLLRYEIDCNGQDQKADRQFDHGILQRRVKRL